MPTYPTTLPVPSADGYQLAPVNQTVRTDMEAGAARQRRRTTARNDQITLSFVFTDAEMAVFRTWFDDPTEAAGGSAWFDGLYLASGSGVAQQECRFIAPWTADFMPGLLWKVQAKVEVR